MSFLDAEQRPWRDGPNHAILRQLLDFLLSGEVKPGGRIPSERQLAEALSVGRGTIREAIKSLSLLGLLEQRVGDGTYLSGSSSDLLPQVIEWGILLGGKRVEDLLEARFILEIQLAGLAAGRRTEAELETLRGYMEIMRSAGSDVESYAQADISFHLAIAAASHNMVLTGILENIRSLLQAWVFRVIRAAGETSSSLAMHEPIFDAIAARDSAGAMAAMTAHMERATKRLKATLPE